MFNLSQAVAALRDCETVASSSLLTEDEKHELSMLIAAQLPDACFFPTPGVPIVRAAIERRYAPRAQEESGQAERLPEPTSVAPEGNQEAEEASEGDEGQAEGVEEQASESPRVSGSRSRGKRKATS